eukprot:XP_001701327.1 predicted protein [Chlamydomonas reinhardtii]
MAGRHMRSRIKGGDAGWYVGCGGAVTEGPLMQCCWVFAKVCLAAGGALPPPAVRDGAQRLRGSEHGTAATGAVGG